MPIKDILLNAQVSKNLDDIEVIYPINKDMRNCVSGDSGIWSKRFGYGLKWSLTSIKSVDLLIPKSTGYAVSNKRVYTLPSLIGYTGQDLNGTNTPYYSVYGSTIILTDGGNPVKISSGNTALLGGSPPNGKWSGVVSNYTLMAGQNNTECQYSALQNPESWPGENTFSFVNTGETLKRFLVKNNIAYFWFEEHIEIWVNTGGSNPFIRQEKIDDIGCNSGDSVIVADDRIFWQYKNNIYQFEGFSPKIISVNYSKYIKNIGMKDNCFALHIKADNQIMWCFPEQGLNLIYDYKKQIIFEWNTWENGSWQRLPVKSYMELDNTQYFGSYNADGSIFQWASSYLSDNTQPIRYYRKFSAILEKDYECRINKFRLRADRNILTDSVSNPKCLFNYRLDNKGDWNTEEVNLGSLGDTNNYVDIRRGGVGKEVEIELIHTDNTKFIPTLLSVDYTIGAKR